MTPFAGRFLVAFAFLQTFSTLGLEVKEGRGLAEFHYGLILGLNGVLIVLFELPLSMWIRRYSQRHMIVLGYCLIGAGFACFAVAEGIAPLVAGMVIMTVGEMIALPVCMAHVSVMAPESMRGRYMGVWGFSWSFAMVLATSGGLALYGAIGSSFWIVVAALSLLGAAIMSVNAEQVPPAAVPKRARGE